MRNQPVLPPGNGTPTQRRSGRAGASFWCIDGTEPLSSGWIRLNRASADSIVNQSGAKDVHVTYRWGPCIPYNDNRWEIRYQCARLLRGGSAERFDISSAR